MNLIDDTINTPFIYKKIWGNKGLCIGGLVEGSPDAATNVVDVLYFFNKANSTAGNVLAVNAEFVTNGCSDGYNIVVGGYNTSTTNILYYASSANFTSYTFGTLSVTKGLGAGISNGVYAIFAAGYNESNVIDYVNISINSNAVDFGDTKALGQHTGSNGNLETAFIFNKYNSYSLKTYTRNSASLFADLIGYSVYCMATNNLEISIIKNEWNAVGFINKIQKIIHSNQSTATLWGYCAFPCCENASMSNGYLGVFAGGHIGTGVRIGNIDYINFSNQGNSTNFGNLTSNRSGGAGASGD